MLVSDGDNDVCGNTDVKPGHYLTPALAERALAVKAIHDVAAKLGGKLIERGYRKQPAVELVECAKHGGGIA